MHAPAEQAPEAHSPPCEQMKPGPPVALQTLPMQLTVAHCDDPAQALPTALGASQAPAVHAPVLHSVAAVQAAPAAAPV